MRWLGKLFCFLVLAPGLVMAQSSTQNTGSTSTTSVADELKALREAIAQQQQLFQQQLQQQQERIDALQKQLESKTAGTPHVENAALNTPSVTNPTAAAASDMPPQDKPKESPLSFRIGGADFTPGGFIDFENIFRSTNTGNVTATSFGGIPFSNTVGGHLTEYRATGQYSRYSLRVDTKFGANIVRGYLEGDFNGNDAGNVFVSSNPHTDRIRLYWVDLKRGNWEFLGGQTWGLQTPNRVGLSPNPADLYVTLGEDAQTHVGINYTRAAEFRTVYHFNDKFQWGIAIQNPQQFTNGEVTFPFVFTAQLASQFDNGSAQPAGASNPGVPGAPNVAPDFITKMAYDSDPAGRHFHVELGALMTSAKITVIPPGGSSFVSNSKIGGGVMASLNYELFPKKVRFIMNGMWGNGVGRYLIGFAPQAVVRPDGEVSMVHSGDGTVGFELQPGPKTQFGVYYGGIYAQRNFFLDPTNPAPGRFAGFGAPNSATSHNRAIQEGTIDWTQTFWKNPQYGAVLLVTQASYVTRAPWFVALGAPKNAHLMMGYVSLRYVLP